MDIKTKSFNQLIKENKELVKLRSKYASVSYEDRRFIAEHIYNEDYAIQLFNTALMKENVENFEERDSVVGAIRSLAIDPDYAPAILTVGTAEYLYQRQNEAMKHLLTLPTLPKNTNELAIIIDKAADFLLDNNDYKNAKKLLSLAIKNDPKNALYHNSVSYCYAFLGNKHKAIKEAQLAVNLAPDSYEYLSDLGWCFVEDEQYDNAEKFLLKAIALAPNEQLAKNNLQEMSKRKDKTNVN